MVEEMLAARGVDVTYETIRRWAENSGRFRRLGERHPNQKMPLTHWISGVIIGCGELICSSASVGE
jgi:hypothetical protein